jgi:hypothetical protein
MRHPRRVFVQAPAGNQSLPHKGAFYARSSAPNRAETSEFAGTVEIDASACLNCLPNLGNKLDAATCRPPWASSAREAATGRIRVMKTQERRADLFVNFHGNCAGLTRNCQAFLFIGPAFLESLNACQERIYVFDSKAGTIGRHGQECPSLFQVEKETGLRIAVLLTRSRVAF